MEPFWGALVVVAVGIATFVLGRVSRGGEISTVRLEALARAEAARKQAEAQAQAAIREA